MACNRQNLGLYVFETKDLENMGVNGLINLVANTSSLAPFKKGGYIKKLLRLTCHLGP